MFIIKSLGALTRIRDGSEAGDPMLEVTPDAWVPFAHCPKGLEEPGNAEVYVREVSEEEAALHPPGKRLNALPKPTPAATAEQPPPPPEAPPAPAKLSQTVEPERLEQVMSAQKPAEGAEAPRDAFEADVDDSATEPKDKKKRAAATRPKRGSR